ncbi:MAG: hypothetical protein RLZZ546_117 [Bacteroidota bacterium]|jgi:hypothetical protein
MNKTHINQGVTYFNRYIDKAPDMDYLDVMQFSSGKYLQNHIENLIAMGDQVYAENKWTIRQILQHLIDTERVFQYRTLRFARRDGVKLPGFDENLFADNAIVKKDVQALVDEFDILRKSVILMFESFSEEDLMSKGTAGENEISVLSLSYILAGHVIHHMDIIKERYFPLL